MVQTEIITMEIQGHAISYHKSHYKAKVDSSRCNVCFLDDMEPISHDSQVFFYVGNHSTPAKRPEMPFPGQ